MNKSLDRLEKLADEFERKLVKRGQDMKYDFNPDQDLLTLKTPANMKKAQELALNAVPETFTGTVTVAVKILKNKSFAISSNVKEVALALKPVFDAQIKSMLAEAGAVKADVVWNWFSFVVSED